MSIATKIASITGAASGIGRASALRFARDGAKLILAGRERAALEETTAEMGAARSGHACRGAQGAADRL